MEPRASARRSWRKLIVVAVAVCMATTGTGAALAQGGGGVGTPDPPVLTDVICLDRCADVRVATIGSKVQLRGRNLDGVASVRFAGDGSGRVDVEPTAVSPRVVVAKVPDGATTGTVIVDAYGTEAETPEERELRIVAPGQIESSRELPAELCAGKPPRQLLRRGPPARSEIRLQRRDDLRRARRGGESRHRRGRRDHD